MSALAEPVVDVAAGDHLAQRNALVLAVTQALAGGNSTVLVATAGIVGTMLAPDKSLATLPISIFVLGMWMGTLPIGVLARRLGRRNALQIGTVCGVLTGLICCLAVLQGSFLLFKSAPCSAGSTPRRISPIALPPPIPRARRSGRRRSRGCWLAASLPASSDRNSSSRPKDLWPPYLFAATYIGQAALALISAGVLMFLNIPKPPRALGGG